MRHLVILLAVFLLLRGTLFRKLSPRVRYALWGVVLLRLLVPFQIPSLSLPASAADLAPELPVLSNRPLSPDTAMGHAVIPSGLLEENGLTIADDGTVQASQSGQDAALWELQENGEVYMYFGGPTLDDVLRAAVVMVWAAGAGGVLLAVLAANLRFAQKLRRSRRPLPTAGCPLPVYEAEGLSSPCLCGVLRPAVYLTPEAAADGTVRTHVLAHELTHFRHRDHIWSLLRCLALALHWYNPLVWAAVVLSKRDGELSCDEGTIRRLGEGERISYGRTLIGLVARRSGAGGALSCSTTMTGGKKTVQRRITQLVKQPETKKTASFWRRPPWPWRRCLCLQGSRTSKPLGADFKMRRPPPRLFAMVPPRSPANSGLPTLPMPTCWRRPGACSWTPSLLPAPRTPTGIKLSCMLPPLF